MVVSYHPPLGAATTASRSRRGLARRRRQKMGKMSSVAAAVVTVMVPAVSAFSRAWSLTNAMMASTHVNEPDLMLSSSVTSGAKLAMQECARQFKTEVWNCPVTAFNIDKDRVENNKETAFINAVTSAG